MLLEYRIQHPWGKVWHADAGLEGGITLLLLGDQQLLDLVQPIHFPPFDLVELGAHAMAHKLQVVSDVAALLE